MTHVHEWLLWIDKEELLAGARCLACDTDMPSEDVVRRLNAVERLSATSAMAASIAARNAGDKVSVEDLLAYASALEAE